MKRHIYISADTRETRLAIVEDGRLVEVKVQREAEKVGSIYKGVVRKVLSGMDCAFVDIGLERNAFMHVSDLVADERVIRGRRGARRRGARKYPRIEKVVKEGDQLLVQVYRAPIGEKGARATTRISLPGRYVVLLPVGANYVGVSRKILDENERRRLRELGRAHRPRGQGLIIRTEGEGCTEEEIAEDVEALKKTWRKIRAAFRSKKAPALLHEELELVPRVIRDMYSDDVVSIVSDSKREYDQAINALRAIDEKAVRKVKLYRGRQPLFDKYGIEEEIARALSHKIWLPKGGNITIDETEAVVAIDVNTARFVGGRGGLEQTILETNLAAVEEIGRQLRLQDLGGIIILDLIDMYNPEHRKQVMAALEEVLRRDRARTRVVHLSPLGLVEMTRKRTGQSLFESSSETCPLCGGRGRVLSAAARAAIVERALRRRVMSEREEAYVVRVPLDVAVELVGPDGHAAEALEEHLRVALFIRGVDRLGPAEFDIEGGSLAALEEQYFPFRKGQMYHVRPREYEFATGTTWLANVEGYIIEVEDGFGPEGELCTVELTEVQRSFAKAVAVE